MRQWAVLGLFLDYGCIPYLILGFFFVVRELVRHRERNRLLTLKYLTENVTGEIALYPGNECIYTWRKRNGQSSGSMMMKVEEYLPDHWIVLSIEKIRIELTKSGSQWKLAREEGWDNSLYLLKNANIIEKGANLIGFP